MQKWQLVLLSLAVACGESCTTAPIKDDPPAPEWIPIEKVHPRIRRQFGELEPGTVMKACNGLVFFGDSSPGLPCGQPHSTCDIVLADGPAEFYNNYTGLKVQSCNFWYCGKHQKQCKEDCPPRQWICR